MFKARVTYRASGLPACVNRDRHGLREQGLFKHNRITFHRACAGAEKRTPARRVKVNHQIAAKTVGYRYRGLPFAVTACFGAPRDQTESRGSHSSKTRSSARPRNKLMAKCVYALINPGMTSAPFASITFAG